MRYGIMAGLSHALALIVLLANPVQSAPADSLPLQEEFDLLDRLLAHEEARLTRLESDHLGDQAADVLLVLRGPCKSAPPQAIRIEDGLGVVNRMFFSAEDRQALSTGGAIEVARTFVEPGGQLWEISLFGKGWSETPVRLSFSPSPRRITLIELDLSSTRPRDGAPSLGAVMWVHEAEQAAIQ